MRGVRRIVPALLSVLALAGCVSTAAETSWRAQRSLVGMPKSALLSCAGVPTRQASADGLEFLTYSSQRIDSVPGWMGWDWGPGWHHPYGAWGYQTSETRSTDCEATFTLRNGVVERLVYGGDGANGIYSQCATIVANCVPPAP